ncbi:MAG: VOC family protein [Acidobacteriaceae bacterium]
MKKPVDLASGELVAFVPTKNPERARAFYEGALGLRCLSSDPFAIVFDANGTTLRVVRVEEFTPASFTVLGWKVSDIAETAARLRENGIAFQKFPGLKQDDNNIWTAPSGTKVAWFLDADGNVLSISED